MQEIAHWGPTAKQEIEDAPRLAALFAAMCSPVIVDEES